MKHLIYPLMLIVSQITYNCFVCLFKTYNPMWLFMLLILTGIGMMLKVFKNELY
jgi:hypothetical protein